jgi:hypothetical protein
VPLSTHDELRLSPLGSDGLGFERQLMVAPPELEIFCEEIATPTPNTKDEISAPARFVVDDSAEFVAAMFVVKVEEFVVPTQPTRISASAEVPNRRR